MNYSNFISECLAKNYSKIQESLKTSPELLNHRDDRLGLSPLLHAVLLNDKSLVSFLLMLGADPNQTSLVGDSPLLEACSSGEIAICKCLVDFGADINAKNTEGETCLLYTSPSPRDS